MRTPPPPGKKLVSDWLNVHVKLKRDMGNGNGRWPKGTKATVVSAGGGLRIASDKCPHCGVSLYMSRVHPDDLEIIK